MNGSQITLGRRLPFALALVLTLSLSASIATPMTAGLDHAVVDTTEDEWPRRSIEEVGLDSGPILRFARDIEASRYKYVDGFSVFRHGALVFDRDYPHDYAKVYGRREDDSCNSCDFYNPEKYPYYRGTRLHTLSSITKSVTSAIFGVAVGRGDIDSIDVPILPLFSDRTIANVDERKRRITLRDLLMMASGLDWDEVSVPYEDPSNIVNQADNSGDFIGFTLDRPMAAEPGTTFAYSGGTAQLLSAIFLKLTGTPIDVYARAHLFGPLGIREFYWDTDAGLPDTGGGLYLRRQDLAKIGQLYLNGGRWKGRQLIPRDWIEASVSPQVSAAKFRPYLMYGYLWWLHDYAHQPAAWGGGPYAWVAAGFGGQVMMIIPEMDLILVATSWNIAENEETGLTPEALVHLAVELGAKRERARSVH